MNVLLEQQGERERVRDLVKSVIPTSERTIDTQIGSETETQCVCVRVCVIYVQQMS